jgi:hypothetical protein
MSSALSAPSSRNIRDKRRDAFREILDAIEIFLNTNEEDKWKRSLVCGVCRLTDAIAINPARLQHLTFKCKSSINGCLKGLGYDIVVASPALSQELLRQIPVLKNDLPETRRWTIRVEQSRSPRTDGPKSHLQLPRNHSCREQHSRSAHHRRNRTEVSFSPNPHWSSGTILFPMVFPISCLTFSKQYTFSKPVFD